MSHWSYIEIEEIKARKKRHVIQKTVNTTQKISERKSQGDKCEVWKATNTNEVGWWKDFRKQTGVKPGSHRLKYIECLIERIKAFEDVKAQKAIKNKTLGEKKNICTRNSQSKNTSN